MLINYNENPIKTLPLSEYVSCGNALKVPALTEEFWLMVERSSCSAASATKETPAIAAFSHLLYAEDATTPPRQPIQT